MKLFCSTISILTMSTGYPIPATLILPDWSMKPLLLLAIYPDLFIFLQESQTYLTKSKHTRSTILIPIPPLGGSDYILICTCPKLSSGFQLISLMKVSCAVI